MTEIYLELITYRATGSSCFTGDAPQPWETCLTRTTLSMDGEMSKRRNLTENMTNLHRFHCDLVALVGTALDIELVVGAPPRREAGTVRNG